MYEVRGYSAGILIFSENIQEELQGFLANKKCQLRKGELSLQFGLGIVQTVRELCIDIYDASGYRPDLSENYKY